MKAKTGDMEPNSKEFFEFSEAAGQEQGKRLIDKLQEGSRNYKTKQGKGIGLYFIHNTMINLGS